MKAMLRPQLAPTSAFACRPCTDAASPTLQRRPVRQSRPKLSAAHDNRTARHQTCRAEHAPTSAGGQSSRGGPSAPPPAGTRPSPSAQFAGPATPADALDLLLGAVQQSAVRLERTLAPLPPGFPPGPSGDSALALLQDPLHFLASTQRQHGDVVGLKLAGERAVLVVDPTVARQVLIDCPGTFIKTGTAFFPGSSLAGNGLLVSDGDVWRRQRQLVAPAFRRTVVETYAAAMVGNTAEMLRWGGGGAGRWRDGVVREVYGEFSQLTLRITLTALFGAGLDAETGKEVTDSIQEAFEYFARRAATAFIIPEFVPTPDNLRFTQAVSRLDSAVYGLIAARRAELQTRSSRSSSSSSSNNTTTSCNNNNHDNNNNTSNGSSSTTDSSAPPTARDLLDSLLLAADAEGQGMEDRALRDELMTLLVAGQETSAILLGWCCALLAHNQSAQAAAAAEVEAVLRGRAPQAGDARGKLPYLEAVVLEALRVKPPAYLVGRCAAGDAVLSGFELPKGTTVLVSPYVMQRDPRWWGPEAEEFQPERWLDSGRGSGGRATSSKEGPNSIKEGQKSSKKGQNMNSASSTGGSNTGGSLAQTALSGMGSNGAYIPFGAGPRNCIGTGFAIMEAVLVLAAVLQRYRLSPLPGAAFPAAQPRITLRPGEVKLILRRRQQQHPGQRIRSTEGR